MDIDKLIVDLILLRQQGCKTIKIYDSTEDKDIELVGKPGDKDYVRIVPEV